MLGRYTSLSSLELEALLKQKGSRLFDKLDKLEELAPNFDVDKAWRSLDNALVESGRPALAKVVFGGECLRPKAQDLFLLREEGVVLAAEELAMVTRDQLHDWFMVKPTKDRWAHPRNSEEFEYTWAQFRGLPTFFAKAALARRHLVFSVS